MLTSDLTSRLQDPVAQTLLIPLGYRAIESRRDEPILNDPRAVEIAEKLHFDINQLGGQGLGMLSTLLRARFIDRVVKDFLDRCPNGIVVDIGCGLDTRFERVDNGMLHWYNLDLPEVIDLRRLLFNDSPRCVSIACSALDLTWMDTIRAQANGNCVPEYLFVSEGVFPYFEGSWVHSLVLAIHANFPGSELVFDSLSPIWLWMGHFSPSMKGFMAKVRWGLPTSQELESWAGGIKLVEEMDYFDQPEPRMDPYRWLKKIPLLGSSSRVAHYRLGCP